MIKIADSLFYSIISSRAVTWGCLLLNEERSIILPENNNKKIYIFENHKGIDDNFMLNSIIIFISVFKRIINNLLSI